MTDIPVKEPSLRTLQKYGLTLADWKQILYRQGGVCAICKTVPKANRLVIDHEHVRNWKRKPANERVKYVRGLLCNFCNYNYLRRGMTIEKALAMAKFLTEYLARRHAEPRIGIPQESETGAYSVTRDELPKLAPSYQNSEAYLNYPG